MLQINLSDLNFVIDKILTLTNSNPSKRIIIAISGGSATGKTSQVSNQINSELLKRGLDSSILSQDNFQLGRDFVDQFEQNEPITQEQKILFAKIAKYKWDLPENFDLPICLQTLQKIKSGTIKITIPNFEVQAVTRIGNKEFVPTQITIFEGLYSFAEVLNNFDFDLKIYVQTPFYARLLRRYFRFVYEMKIPKPEKALKQICTSVLNAHIDYVQPQAQSADIIINIPYNFEETIERLNLQPKAEKLDENCEVIKELYFGKNSESNLQNIGQILLIKKTKKDQLEKYFFVVKFADQIWEKLETNEELKNQIIVAFEKNI